MSHEAKYVPPKRYPFTEDKIFGWVMENQEFCLYLLQIILPDLNIKEIVEFQKQDAMGNDDREAKDIRLDIKVVDDQGRIFDIEMQTTASVYLGRRIRYYQSMMDGDRILKAGEYYSQLPDTYIIFLCSEDPSSAFSKSDNRAVHFFKTIDTKDGSLELNDGSTKVIINSKGDFAGESDELKELAKLMNDEEVSLNE
ncbi:Rpn family recombination-promoting nuclease/putative transposase, partial [Lactobacillus pasteurii]